MLIAICDDDPLWIQKAQDILNEYREQSEMSYDIAAFQNPEELFEESRRIDILFLDIEMGDENGIHAAVKVNERWKNTSIVYLTDYISYAVDVYETIHTYYVLKNQFRERLGMVFEKIRHEKSQMQSSISLNLVDGRVVHFRPEEILYFERDRRITRIMTVDHSSGEGKEVYETKAKIGEIEELLPSLDFARCHNSYIVYFPAVKEINRTSIILRNGEQIPISRQYQGKMRELFVDWARMQ
ncbi:MAG: LytTR family DNA-binding domain-containing protein [Eubacteriales bacterium]|nr:LytTR family DNA-binding domain-containing protein [Eubacteriales bacterium]